MSSVRRLVPGHTFRSFLLLAAITCFPHHAFAETAVPKAFAALFPAEVKIESQSWNVTDTAETADEIEEGMTYGKVGGGKMHGFFPGSVSCDITIGPEFHLYLDFDTAWESSPEQLEMWEMITADDRDFDARAKSRFKFIKGMVNEDYNGVAVAEPKSEQLSNGHVIFVEFNWKCAKNPGGENIWMDGYAHRGTTVLKFSFWANMQSAEATAMASEIFTAFEKLDIAELLK
jgi:hypothetical protein